MSLATSRGGGGGGGITGLPLDVAERNSNERNAQNGTTQALVERGTAYARLRRPQRRPRLVRGPPFSRVQGRNVMFRLL